MKDLSFEEMTTINGGSEVSHGLIKLISILFYSEAKRAMDSASNGGNVAAVVAYK